jgi:hypothetical protein
MLNRLIPNTIIGIGFALCVLAATNTTIMLYINDRLHPYANLIYSTADGAIGAIGVVVMLVGQFLKNLDKRISIYLNNK